MVKVWKLWCQRQKPLSLIATELYGEAASLSLVGVMVIRITSTWVVYYCALLRLHGQLLLVVVVTENDEGVFVYWSSSYHIIIIIMIIIIIVIIVILVIIIRFRIGFRIQI